MVLSNDLSNFVVRQEYFVTEVVRQEYTTAEKERAARHTALALSCLDKTQSLYLSYEQAAVVGNEGGTIGPRPCFALQALYRDLEAYNRHINVRRTHQITSHLYSALDALNLRCTRTFYVKAPEMSMVSLDLRDHFSNEELELLDARPPAGADDFVDGSEGTDGFYILPNTPSNNDPTRKFEVQTTFWSKPGYEEIAQKIAQYTCTIDPKRELYFAVEDEPAVNAENIGEVPTYMMTREFTEIEYRTRLEAELNNPAMIEAKRWLAVSCKVQTCQFWKHLTN